MRIQLPLLAATLLTGCAAQPAVPRSAAPAPTAAAATPPSATSTSTGLAFDPPAAAHAPAPDTARDPRAPAAANGVVESSTSHYNVTTSVQDNSTNGDFTQSTVTQQAGTVRH